MQDGTQDDLELVGHVGIVDVEVVLQIGRFEVACDLQDTPVSNSQTTSALCRQPKQVAVWVSVPLRGPFGRRLLPTASPDQGPPCRRGKGRRRELSSVASNDDEPRR